MPFFYDENVFCQGERSPAQVVGNRRRRPGAGKSGGKGSESVTRQRKDGFHAACGYGRFCDRHQCGESAATGKKEEQKSYMSFSGYVGGHKSENARARRARHPELLIERAVRGMIPHNRLGRRVYRKLKVYRSDSHRHTAQQPQAVKLRKS